MISSFPWFSASSVSLDHVFPHNVSLDHVNPERGNHTESACHGDGKLCSTRHENSSPGDKTSFPCRKTFVSHSKIAIPADDLSVSKIFVRVAIGTAREPTIQNRHFDPVGKRSDLEISGPALEFLSGSVVAGCRCDRIQTPLRSNEHNFPRSYQNRL
ncbi:hypothetical protein Taro_034396 [Colocasia esculenta]|uniref:Uncharacterized protein n=1 Tax=Colocasia esculenta TaxID=4460 RepID=A0A843VXP6_COLES|nr:hypothetical protein [Colocasia esculenta]